QVERADETAFEIAGTRIEPDAAGERPLEPGRVELLVRVRAAAAARVADDDGTGREVGRAGQGDVGGGAAAADVVQRDGVRRPGRPAPDPGEVPVVGDEADGLERRLAARDGGQLPHEVGAHDVRLRVVV